MTSALAEHLRRLTPASPLQASLATLAAAAAVTAVVLLPERAGDGLAGPVRPAPPASRPAPGLAGEAELRRVAATLGRPLYWVGPRDGFGYEVRRTGGNVTVRYLPAGTSPGADAAHLTVGTYPVPDAYRATQAFVAGQSVGTRPVPGGGVAIYRTARPTNVYVVFPGLDYQLEVFSPRPAEALRLATSGALRPVG